MLVDESWESAKSEPAGGAQGVAHGNRGSNTFLIGWSKSTKLHNIIKGMIFGMIGISFEIKISAFS